MLSNASNAAATLRGEEKLFSEALTQCVFLSETRFLLLLLLLRCGQPLRGDSSAARLVVGEVSLPRLRTGLRSVGRGGGGARGRGCCYGAA
jgi:hypothetical protein